MDKSLQSKYRARERQLKSKFRKSIVIAIIISLLVGLAGGFAVGRLTAKEADTETSKPEPTATIEATPVVEVTKEAEATSEPTEAPATEAPVTEAPVTEAPTAEPTKENTPAPTEVPVTLEPIETPESTEAPVTLEPTETPEPGPQVVPFGDSATIHAQMFTDGTVCRAASDSDVIDLTFSLKIMRYLSHDYYVATYGKTYILKGDEAGVEFELTMKDYDGELEIIPQSYLEIKLMTETGVEKMGYQLTDAEIEAQTDVVVENDVPKLLYKRYQHSNDVGDMAYLVVTSYVDGEAQTVVFDLGEPLRPTPTPIPVETLVPMEEGDKNDQVKELQQKLIDKGYLTGKADGAFGKKTTEAVRTAQKDLGLEVTGIADDALQRALED